MKYNDNGEYKDIYVKAFDTLPVGTEVDYDGSVVPSGWTKVEEDFGSLVTFDSGTPANYQFYKIGNLVIINYQSAAKSWVKNDIVFTLPPGYRPVNHSIVVPFNGQAEQSNVNYTVFGISMISTDGKCTIINTNNSTSGQRIGINATFVIEEAQS